MSPVTFSTKNGRASTVSPRISSHTSDWVMSHIEWVMPHSPLFRRSRLARRVLRGLDFRTHIISHVRMSMKKNVTNQNTKSQEYGVVSRQVRMKKENVHSNRHDSIFLIRIGATGTAQPRLLNTYHFTRTNVESCHTYENESCHTYENESYHTYENKSCHTYENESFLVMDQLNVYIISHVRMSRHVTHMRIRHVTHINPCVTWLILVWFMRVTWLILIWVTPSYSFMTRALQGIFLHWNARSDIWNYLFLSSLMHMQMECILHSYIWNVHSYTWNAHSYTLNVHSVHSNVRIHIPFAFQCVFLQWNTLECTSLEWRRVLTHGLHILDMPRYSRNDSQMTHLDISKSRHESIESIDTLLCMHDSCIPMYILTLECTFWHMQCTFLHMQCTFLHMEHTFSHMKRTFCTF